MILLLQMPVAEVHHQLPETKKLTVVVLEQIHCNIKIVVEHTGKTHYDNGNCGRIKLSVSRFTSI